MIEPFVKVELHSVIEALAVIDDCEYSLVTIGHRHNGTSRISSRHTARLAGGRTNKQRRRVKIQRSINLDCVLPDVIDAENPLRCQLALDTDRSLLRVWIQQLARISFQLADV